MDNKRNKSAKDMCHSSHIRDLGCIAFDPIYT